MPFYLKPGRHNLGSPYKVMEETPPADQVIQLNNMAADVQLGKPSSKNESSRGWLDRFQDVLTTLHALAIGDKDAAKKHGRNAILYGLSSVPGAGDAFAYANMAKKGTQFVKQGGNTYKVLKGLGKYEGAVSGKNLLTDARDHAEETFAKVGQTEKV